jgi:hypothetical protein
MRAFRLSKFCFQIKTRGGALVSNLMIPGVDEADARRKLQQIYHNCQILSVRYDQPQPVVHEDKKKSPTIRKRPLPQTLEQSFEDIVDILIR